MLLQEVNEPILNMAVSKATSFLGAVEVNITDGLIWDKDYHGKLVLQGFIWGPKLYSVVVILLRCMQDFYAGGASFIAGQ